jgi:CMP-N,N'-diacetyllegionaminic acid synthase
MVILGLIPARGGSKGIPHKNERMLAGRTLVERAAETARRSDCIDRLLLTTDSSTIAALGEAAGVDVLMRPAELARDDTPMFPVVVHAVEELERQGWRCEAVALLQPTQPLRRPEHIRLAVDLLVETGGSSVVSVVPIPSHQAPQYAMRIDGGRLRTYLPEGAALTRRQDVDPAYTRDGTIYLVRRETLAGGDLYGDDCRALLVAADESVNLDTSEDWARAETLLSG